jgi:hypothetical protein
MMSRNENSGWRAALYMRVSTGRQAEHESELAVPRPMQFAALIRRSVV